MPKIGEFAPYYTALEGAVKLYQGSALKVLPKLPAKSVHCVVTSPPYWALRDYGTSSWEGGNSECDHIERNARNDANNGFRPGRAEPEKIQYIGVCKKCGAKRVDEQLGAESTPEEYVENLVSILRQVHRVLRDDGTLWLNLGDTYQQSGGNLAGVPWRVALALQADGWVLRQDIIWYSPSKMPESVINRCTKAHEYIFLLTKSEDYYFDQAAIKERSVGVDEDYQGWTPRKHNKQAEADPEGKGRTKVGWLKDTGPRDYSTANKRSVWTVSSQGYDGAHFAVFPPKLIEPCILAGCPEHVCQRCSAPFIRQVEKTKLLRERPNDYVKRNGAAGTGNSCANTVAGVDIKTLGWEPSCGCYAGSIGGTVLDPFMGSGTTAVVALQQGKQAIGIELNEDYIRNQAITRIEGAALSRPALAASLESVKRERVKGGGSLL